MLWAGPGLSSGSSGVRTASEGFCPRSLLSGGGHGGVFCRGGRCRLLSFQLPFGPGLDELPAYLPFVFVLPGDEVQLEGVGQVLSQLFVPQGVGQELPGQAGRAGAGIAPVELGRGVQIPLPARRQIFLDSGDLPRRPGMDGYFVGVGGALGAVEDIVVSGEHGSESFCSGRGAARWAA